MSFLTHAWLLDKYGPALLSGEIGSIDGGLTFVSSRAATAG